MFLSISWMSTLKQLLDKFQITSLSIDLSLVFEFLKSDCILRFNLLLHLGHFNLDAVFLVIDNLLNNGALALFVRHLGFVHELQSLDLIHSTFVVFEFIYFSLVFYELLFSFLLDVFYLDFEFLNDFIVLLFISFLQVLDFVF
jgi:hypothetical protein